MTLRRFLGLLGSHVGTLSLAAAVLPLNAALPAVAVALVHRAVTNPAQDERPALGAAIAAIALGHGALMVLRTTLTKRVAWRVAEDLRRRVHAAYLSGRPDGLLGDRLARLGDEIDQVQYGVSAMVTALRNPITLLGLALVTAALAPIATGWAIAMVLPLWGMATVGGRAVRTWAMAQRAARAEWLAVTTSQLANLETVQALGAEDDEAARFARATAADRSARVRLDVGRTLPVVGVQGLAAVAIAVVVTQSGGPGLDDAVVVITAMALAQRPLTGLTEVWTLLQRSLGALDQIEAALATPRRIEEPIAPSPLPEGPLTLRWEEVSVERGGRTILDGVTAEARPGEIVALVGPTGVGKTTLLRLAWRAFDPDAGRVTLGAVDLRDVTSPARRAAIASVPQDLVLWGRTVAENLTMGLSPEAVDRTRIEEALRRARADFVFDWPDGIDTRLAEGARGLSGGERQRLCIARALVRGARVWLLDEPTSHVDAAVTADLGRVLRDAGPLLTILVVAHDPLVVSWADRVIRLSGGRSCTDVSPP